ncbi:MAG: hypothetical protein KJO10_11650 [Gammaproteobacteria bacterium]|nr:hypothetical protein [Gammaproteobacteria bacterium]
MNYISIGSLTRNIQAVDFPMRFEMQQTGKRADLIQELKTGWELNDNSRNINSIIDRPFQNFIGLRSMSGGRLLFMKVRLGCRR